MRKLLYLFVLFCFFAFSNRMSAQEISPLKFNEVMVANIDQFVDPCWNYGSWVEIYNESESNVFITGYWLSDDVNDLKQWRISTSQTVPAKGFLNLWFDNYGKYSLTQMDMKLDADGASLYLSNSDGDIVASVNYPPAVARSSYARITDGHGDWQWSYTPTPAASNVGMCFAEERLPIPEVSCESGFYTMPIEVTVTIPEGCKLRYTTDGSTPTRTHGMTSADGNFTVSKSSVYRFALVRDGYLSSKVVTRSFLTQEKPYSIPVISIATDSVNLYSDQLGIFVKGTNGRPGRGTSEPCNWNQDWERPCNFEFLSPEGTSLINQETWISRCGAWSRSKKPYSFKIHAQKVHEGQNTLDYPFFEAKPYLKHKMLQIRNGGNDNTCRVKDAFLQQLVATSGLNVDYQEYYPVAHYINGTYYGVINMREPNNKQHVYANYGLDDDEIDLYEIDADSGYVQKCGTKYAWKKLCENGRVAALPSYYEKVVNALDIDAFCNYMAVELYLGSTDWPKNNLKAFRPIAEGGRFRFILYDLDHSFYTNDPFTLFASRKTHTFNTLYWEPVSNITQEIEVVTLFLNLLKNANFRKRFIDTYCLVAGSVFESERCRKEIERLANRVADMQMTANAYGTNASPWSTAYSMMNSLQNRLTPLINALKNYSSMQLGDVTPQKIELYASTPMARMTVNEISIPTNVFKGMLFPPVTLKAEEIPGYRFMGWKEGSSAYDYDVQTLIPINAQWTYYDKGPLERINWKSNSFVSKIWKQGAAPLGYGNIHTYATTLNYGGNPNLKYSTYYFRHPFSIEDIPEDAKFELEYEVDDGMVIYVNEKEAYRYNMPAGAIRYHTFSTTYAGDNPLTGVVQLDKSLFQNGENVIAVEVHNTSQTSSDIHWDMSLKMLTPKQYIEEDVFLSTEKEIQMPQSDEAIVLTACYNKLDAQQNPLTPIVINEVSAGNSIYINDYHKKADWIELYNTTAEEIDLEGYYLSDDLSDPTKWKLTSGTQNIDMRIPANGYKIVWCDKQSGITQVHANFKLANENGAAVLLTSPDATWADTLVYCAHDGDETVGRYPDASDSIYLMARPTIAKSNVKNMYATRWKADVPSVDHIFNARQGGLSIACLHEELLLKSEEDENVQLSITSMSGQVVMRKRMKMTEWNARVNISLLRKGVYVATLSDSNDNRCTIKFSKP